MRRDKFFCISIQRQFSLAEFAENAEENANEFSPVRAAHLRPARECRVAHH